MFCGNCGHKNPPNSKFCEKCGSTLQTTTTPAYVPAGKSARNGKRGRLASIGSVIVLVCFFLPWVVVSCGASEMEISGNEFASGNITISEGADSFTTSLSELLDNAGIDDVSNSGSGGYPALYLVFIFGLLGFMGFSQNRSGSILALAGGILGLIGMFIAHMKFSGFENDLSNYSFGALRMDYQFPYFAEWFGFAIQSLFAYFGITDT